MRTPDPVLKPHPTFPWAQELCITSRMWQSSLQWDDETAAHWASRGATPGHFRRGVEYLVRLAAQDDAATINDIATYSGLDQAEIDEIIAPATV